MDKHCIFYLLILILQHINCISSNNSKICDCGWKNEKTNYYGAETRRNEYPFLAILFEKLSESVLCSVAIISEKYALSTAHCVHKQLDSTTGILVANESILTDYGTGSKYIYDVKTFIVHENFDPNTNLNDIALIKTKKPIAFSVSVGPVCLPYGHVSNTFVGKTLIAVGRKYPDNDYKTTNYQVMSNEICVRKLTNNVINHNQICSHASGNEDCYDEFEDFLLWKDGNINKLQVVGIGSYNKGCGASTPRVNTRISSYLNWIILKTLDSNYCIQ